jgi:hypothetical protein
LLFAAKLPLYYREIICKASGAMTRITMNLPYKFNGDFAVFGASVIGRGGNMVIPAAGRL